MNVYARGDYWIRNRCELTREPGDQNGRQRAECKIQETCQANFIYTSLFKQQALTESPLM